MLVVDLRNTRINVYNYSVVGNKNSDIIYFYYPKKYQNYEVYVKALGQNVADKFRIHEPDIEVKDDCIRAKWVMPQSVTTNKDLQVQLEYDITLLGGGEIAQSKIVALKLQNTLDINGEVEPVYPSVLQELREDLDAEILNREQGDTALHNEIVAEKNRAEDVEGGLRTDLDNHTADKTNPHEVTKEQVGLGNADNTSDIDKPISTAQQQALDNKVDKVTGKGLSTNDFTDALKEKLNNIEAGAQVNTLEVVKVNNQPLTPANKEINIDLTPYAEISDMQTYGKSLAVSIDPQTYVLTMSLKDANGNTLNSQEVDLPLETMVVSGSYDDTTKSLILVLKNGQTITIPVAELVAGLVSEQQLATALQGYYTKTEVDNALGLKANQSDLTAHTGDTSNPHSVTKAQVGLGNVDNTSDQDKPVSTAQQQALDLKADKNTTYSKTETDNLLNDKVDKVAGKQLSTEDYTTAEKNKVAGIEAGAQVNIIEGVKVNGQPLTPTSKVVDIDLSSYAKIVDMETYGKSLEVSMNSSTYVVTFTLKDKNSNVLSTQTIDLPLESVVVGGSYDSVNKAIILTLDNGNTITIPVADLVSGLVSTTDLATALASYYTKTESDTRFATKTEAFKMVELTWAELKALRDNSQLVKGMQYRITDYVTTTAQQLTQSANHQFDVIVVADDVNKLNENARAINHAGDTYFANSKLSSWEIKYCLDNDTNRFAWADATNGKGIIYYMLDEFGNSCSYDFKNIQFARYKITACEKCPSLVGKYLGNYDLNGALNLTRDMSVDTNDVRYYYTFDCCQTDYSMNAIGTTLTRPDSSTFTLDQIQCLDCHIPMVTIDTGKRYLNNIIVVLEASRDCSFTINGFDSRSSTLLGGATEFVIGNISNSIVGSIGSSYIDGYTGQYTNVKLIRHSLICNDGVVFLVFASSQVGVIIESDIVGGSGQMFSYSTIKNILYSTLKTSSSVCYYSNIGTIWSCNLQARYIFYYVNLVDIYGCNGVATTIYCGYSQIDYIYQITEVIENNENPDMFIMNSNITFLRECSFKELNGVKVLYLWNSSFKKVNNTNFSRHIGITCSQDLNGCNFEGKVGYVNISSSNTSQVISNTNIHGVSGEENNVKNIVLNEDYSVEHTVDVYTANHSIVEV